MFRAAGGNMNLSGFRKEAPATLSGQGTTHTHTSSGSPAVSELLMKHVLSLTAATRLSHQTDEDSFVHLAALHTLHVETFHSKPHGGARENIRGHKRFIGTPSKSVGDI